MIQPNGQDAAVFGGAMNCARRLARGGRIYILDASALKFERMLPTHSPFQIIEASKN
jgi:hypothetical protein